MPKDHNLRAARRESAYEESKAISQRMEDAARLPQNIVFDDSTSRSGTKRTWQEPIDLDDYEPSSGPVVEFPGFDKMCLIRASDTLQCPECIDGILETYETCPQCASTDTRRGVKPDRCHRCDGSGRFNHNPRFICFECRGRGQLGPKCTMCDDNQTVLTHTANCQFCQFNGRASIGRLLAKYGTPEYLTRMSEVMINCLELREVYERGFQLYLILQEIREYQQSFRRQDKFHQLSSQVIQQIDLACQQIAKTTPV